MNTPRDFKTHLAEGFTIVDGALIVNWNSKDGQSTEFGKTSKKKKFVPYSSHQKKFNGVGIYSVYQLDKQIGVQVLKSIKKKSPMTIGVSEYDSFITRTAIYMCSKPSGMLDGIDIIISPDTSSFFNDDILREISKRKPHIKILKEAFVKSNVSDIVLDYSKYPNVTDKTKTAMDKIIKTAKNNGFIEVKKVPKMFLNYISGVLKLDPKIKLANLENKNVLIFDDLFASGFTIKEMINSTLNYAPKSLKAVTVFKTK